MSVETAISLWQQQISFYERVVKRCTAQITKPLSRFPPPEFQVRQQEFKDILMIKPECKQDDLHEYMDVVVDLVEGRKDKSMIQLADQLTRVLGGELKFWQNFLLDVAENVNYAGEFTIWQVKKPFQERLYVDAENLSQYRQFCKVAKKYLTDICLLIKSIKKFDRKKDSISKIDQQYKKLKKSQANYIGIGEETNMLETSGTFDELSNHISQNSKNNAKKTLFHFFKPKSKKQTKLPNTLLNYNFTITRPKNEKVSQPTSNIFITQQMMKGTELQQFQNNLKNIKQCQQNMQYLKESFVSQKAKDEEANENPVYTSIWDKDYYFSYSEYQINRNGNIRFSDPFQRYDFVNYEIDSEEEFQELLGDDVDEASDMSDASSEFADSFVVSDDHLSDDEDQGKTKQKISINSFFGQPWSYDGIHSNKFESQKYNMVCLVNTKQPLPLSQHRPAKNFESKKNKTKNIPKKQTTKNKQLPEDKNTKKTVQTCVNVEQETSEQMTKMESIRVGGSQSNKSKNLVIDLTEEEQNTRRETRSTSFHQQGFELDHISKQAQSRRVTRQMLRHKKHQQK